MGLSLDWELFTVGFKQTLIGYPDEPVCNLKGFEHSPHENGCAPAPNPGFDQSAGYFFGHDIGNARLQIIEIELTAAWKWQDP